MQVFGLSGKSGTGKSFHAGELCANRDIRGLIDDGLFLYDGNIVTGISAKKQATSMAAIKTALFTDDDHCISVQKALSEYKPDKLLIIGTSDRMIEKIRLRLGLPAISEFIYIEDITTEEQREKAKHNREDNGMHVIPAPTFQVQKQFSGFFLDPRKSFNINTSIEKTIVRPTYSYLGDFIISDKVISDIVAHAAELSPGVSDVLWTAFDNDENGCVVRTVLLMKEHAHFRTTAEEIQDQIYEMVSRMTSFNVLGVEVEIRGYR